MAQSQGYTVGNLKDLDARFKCSHCRLLLREPMQGDCGHRYCRVCVQTKYSEEIRRGQVSLCGACDPAERAEISPDRTYPDAAVRREINRSLVVLCPNSPCERTMHVKDLEYHEAVCEFKPQTCNQCGQAVPAAELDSHRRVECPKRLDQCKVCKESVPHDKLEEHRSTTCVGSTVQCEFCLRRVKDSEAELEKHRRSECPAGWHEDKQCPYGCAEMPKGWRDHRESCLVTHLDRLVVMRAQTVSQQAQETVGTADRSSGGGAAAAAAAAAATVDMQSGVDFEALSGLKERADLVERRLAELTSLTGQAGDQNAARQHLRELQTALAHGEKLTELLSVIGEEFEKCCDKIRLCEQRMRKDSERKLDIERKHQEMLKLLVYKEMKISDLERRIEILEHAGCNGILLWKINDVRRRREEAKKGTVASIYSPPFYTSKAGYKMAARIYLNGDGAGKNTHLSLFLVIMRGEYDALLPWPFVRKVTMMLLDQNFEQHFINAFRPDGTSASFKKPSAAMNTASGFPMFLALGELEGDQRGYVKEDTMFVKIIVDTNDLP